MIKYSFVEKWQEDRAQMDNRNLRRIKLCGISRAAMIRLLNSLGRESRLEHLEIYRFEMLQGTSCEYSFSQLDMLAIDCVKVIDDASVEVIDGGATIKFNSSRLKSVYFGMHRIIYIFIYIFIIFCSLTSFIALLNLFPSFSKGRDVVDFVKFGSPETIVRLSANGAGRHLARFPNLLWLEYNQIQELSVADVMEIVRERSRQLIEFRCNLDQLIYAGFEPSANDRQFFENLYGALREYFSNDGDQQHDQQDQLQNQIQNPPQSRLKVYFHNILLNFDRSFTDYGFERKLVAVHLAEFILSLQQQREDPCCPTVLEVNYFDFYDTMQHA